MADDPMVALLAAVRNYLSITWVDADLDSKITGMINRGITYVDDCGGDEFDYAAEGQARSLLFDYVRYARSGALSDFWADYRVELVALRSATEVAKYVADNPDV